MPRVKRGVTARARHKKVLALAKGFRGRRGNVFRIAKQAVMKAGQYAYRDRRNKKRVFRQLWIARINAAARECGLTYSQFALALNHSWSVIVSGWNSLALADVLQFYHARQLKALKAKLSHSKDNDLEISKSEIKMILEEEIIKHYYLEKGMREASFNGDAEVKAALALFKDPNRYQEILKGKKN
jgi:ribosomal protein L20